MKLWTLAVLTLLLAGCADSYPTTEQEKSLSVCQGFGCETQPGKLPTSAATHKPTRDEKIRARQGQNPDFGSENIRVSAPIHF